MQPQEAEQRGKAGVGEQQDAEPADGAERLVRRPDERRRRQQRRRPHRQPEDEYGHGPPRAPPRAVPRDQHRVGFGDREQAQERGRSGPHRVVERQVGDDVRQHQAEEDHQHDHRPGHPQPAQQRQRQVPPTRWSALSSARGGHAGHRSRTTVPRPGADSTVAHPPTAAIRSSTDSASPKRCAPTASGSNPTPSSATAISTIRGTTSMPAQSQARAVDSRVPSDVLQSLGRGSGNGTDDRRGRRQVHRAVELDAHAGGAGHLPECGVPARHPRHRRPAGPSCAPPSRRMSRCT